MCLCLVRSCWIHPIRQMGHVQVDSEMNVNRCHGCKLTSQVASRAVCQISHELEECQQGDIHNMIDHNILVRFITGLEIEECTCSMTKKSTTGRSAFILVLKRLRV